MVHILPILHIHQTRANFRFKGAKVVGGACLVSARRIICISNIRGHVCVVYSEFVYLMWNAVRVRRKVEHWKRKCFGFRDQLEWDI